MCSAIAHASDRPSSVLVPRPISSRMTRLRVGGVVEDVGGLGHLDHERRSARACSSSLAPMRVKMRSTRPIVAALRRDEAADLRQQRDQRDLADVGALAGHVRAGDERERVVVGAKRVSLATNSLPSCCSSTGWRPSTISSTRLVDDRRAAVAALLRERRQRRQHVDPRQAVGQLLERADVRQQRLADAARRAVCSSAIALVLRAERLVLELLQLRRDVALGVLDRLLARSSRRGPCRVCVWVTSM